MGRIASCLSGLLLIAFPVHSQEKALAYLESISSQYESVVRAQWQYARLVVEGADYQREKERLIRALDEAEQQISSIAPFGENSSLKDSLLLFLSLNRKMVREDYTRLADLKNLEEKSFEQLDEFLFAQEKAYRRLGELAIALRKEEEEFARTHGIRLVNRDDRFAKKLLEMNELFSYYNAIYLSFYKAYSQELIVYRTIESQQAPAIKESLLLLEEYAREGIRSVRRHGGYRGDRRLYDAALACLEFYRDEAENKLPEIFAYYRNVGMLDSLARNRQEGARNSEEYNALVKEINAAGKSLNAINERLNNRRAVLLDRWNDVSANFLAVQLP